MREAYVDNQRTPEETARSGDAPSATLHGRWLVFARAAWLAVAALTLGLDAAGIPYAYAQYKSVCSGASCETPLTSNGLRALHEMGLSAGFFAAYIVAAVMTAALVYCAVAAVIFWRRSNDKMALFSSFALLTFGSTASSIPQAATHPAFWFPAYFLYYIGQVSFVVFFYLFPDGRFVPRWTRWLAIVAALLFVPRAFFPGSSLDLLNSPLYLILIGTTAVAQVYRYRSVSNPWQRQQTKWVVFGVAVAMVGFSAVITLFNIVPSVLESGPLVQMAGITLIQGSIALIPLAIGVAILRSRLYDIDVVINRTLVYGALTATLALVYVGSVVVLQQVFRTLTGGESQLAVVASTLAIAALFNPLRRRIQNFIDRIFYRKKYDSARILASFGARLRDETDLDDLNDHLVEVVRETMQPAHVSLWLREPGDER